MTLNNIQEYDRKILIQAIEIRGEENQKIVAMEELSELQKEIAKDLRGDANSYNLAEEIADVMIMIEQLRMMYDIDSKIEMFWEHKIERLKEKNKEDEQ